jgi:DNA replication initiation complex subunit (GINS family)
MDENVSQKEVAVTYETLYEMLRREKSRDELQTLDEGFLLDVLNYLRDKQKMLDDAERGQDLFSLEEREKTQVQIVNIRKIVRELYERREKKIIEMALNKSRTKSNLIDTSTLLVHERYLFDSIVSVLDSFRGSVLHNVLSLREPSLTIDVGSSAIGTPGVSVPQSAPAQSSFAQPLSETPPLPPAAFKHVKFTQPVEQFVGKELELYGPFQPDQREQLPADIADILIEKGSAIEVRE